MQDDVEGGNGRPSRGTVGHFYFAQIGHFYFAATHRRFAELVAERLRPSTGVARFAAMASAPGFTADAPPAVTADCGLLLGGCSLINYTIMISSILYFQRNTTGAALISSKY